MKMSLLYYSRMRCIMQLLPLLLASQLPAHIISVFGAGLEGDKLFMDDLSLQKPGNFSFVNFRSHVVAMKTLFMERLAKQHPQLSLTHVYPGLVQTPAFTYDYHPLWFKVLWTILGPILRTFIAISPDECGNRMLFLASSRFPPRQGSGDSSDAMVGSDGKPGSGAYAMSDKSEPVPVVKKYEKYQEVYGSDISAKVWDHTMDVFATIEAGKAYKA